ncbi:unnamed protein product [Ixodes persulcatus]
MMDHITEVGDVFVKVIDKNVDKGKEVCMLKTMQGLAMDYIGRAAFGINTTFQDDLNNPFLITAQRTLKEVMTGPFHILAHCTTSLRVLAAPILRLNQIFGSFSFIRFTEKTAMVIELRKKNPELRRNDILQNLIDAEYEEPAAAQASSSNKTTKGTPKDVSKTRTLTSEEVVMNTTMLFVAGFETTATALPYLTFALGKYPDVQDKVRQEVQEALEGSGSLDETVTQRLKYVEQVVNETMRLWPPVLT